MKRYLLHSASRLGLLRAAEQVHGLGHALATARGNARFRRADPAFAVPPAGLSYAALGHTSCEEYRDTGLAHARVVADLVDARFGARAVAVLEWGCGPGRIVRHLPALRAGGLERLDAVDVRADAIAWCRAHLPGIGFQQCGAAPPLPFAPQTFDVVYHYSVFTHLADASIAAWSAEIARVLRPGGMMIGTSHGDAYRRLLLRTQRARYDAGDSVRQALASEGTTHYLSFHPPAAMRALLEPAFRQVEWRCCPLAQDLWIATR
jgi:SAM-dependent methyltransferase